MLKVGGHDVAVPDARALAQHLFEDDLEMVTRLHVVVEVDVAREDVGQRNRERDVLAGSGHRRDERGVLAIDLAADGHEPAFLSIRRNLHCVRGGGVR